MTEIKTERLVLKKPRHKDKQSIISQIGDWEVVKWLSEVPYPYTEDDADDWINSLSRQELTFNIFQSDVLIGGIRLTHDDDDDYYDLGYWLGRGHWGQGFATEACKSLLHYATEKLDIRKFKSSYMTGNDDSARVLAKLGYRKTGEGKMYCLSRKTTLPCIYLVIPLHQ